MMLIAKIKIDSRGRVQLPSCFVKANGWNENGEIYLKNHTHKDKVVLEYVKDNTLKEVLKDELSNSINQQQLLYILANNK